MSKNRKPVVMSTVYERRAPSRANAAQRSFRIGLTGLLFALAAGVLSVPHAAQAQSADASVLDARDALRKKDRNRLAADRAAANAANHPLAMWVEYWELNNRLGEASQAEFDAFAARWSGSYVEDRLRNDWLLELGRRRDWVNFAAEFPRFRMNDDREVTCYALLVDHLAGKDVKQAAMAAWLAQRDADDGCALMAGTLYEDKQFSPGNAWRKARFAIDANRPRAARQAALLISPAAAAGVDKLSDSTARYLAKSASAANRTSAELTTLALMRLAGSDPDAAAQQLNDRWDRALPADLSAWAWAMVAKQSAMKLQTEAPDRFQRATLRGAKAGAEPDWPDDTLAWKVRAALRADNGRARWQQVVQAVNAMSPNEQKDSAWVYWKARAMQAMAKDSQDGETMRGLGHELLSGIASQLNFYGALAAESLGQPIALPPRPAPLSPAEIEAAAQHPGLKRALLLITIGLRGEGVREWNYSLRDMSDRQLLAAAQLACNREVWDRCINTSDRTREEVDLDQRYPMPFRKDVTARAREIGLDPAYVYGLIRQESRFIMDARSNVGASGLMQLMPATARWTAKKLGVPYTADLITDRDTNLRLGTGYLKLVLDDFSGSQALAAAAYNAGPGRPRKWRDGPQLEPAIWAENIPFAETRDYVKKVLSNGTYYAALLSGQPPSLKARLGRPIGPVDPAQPVPDLP
ncbi:lytic transglycosylase domain-containing protein [soil metagenome]